MTQTDICNLALAKIGEYNISSITEDSAAARQCARAWDNTRRMLLRDYDWNFATFEATLSQLSGQAAFEYDYAYALPSDYLRALKFNRTTASPGQAEWKIANGKLYSDLSDATNAKLEYIADVTDATKWDDVFVNAFAFYLAGSIAPSVAGSPELGINMAQAGERFLADAKGSDVQEGGLRAVKGWQRSRLQEARGGLYGGSIPAWMWRDYGVGHF